MSGLYAKEVPPVQGAVHFKQVEFTAYDSQDGSMTLLFAHRALAGFTDGVPDVSIVYYSGGKYLMTDQLPYVRAHQAVAFLVGRGWIKREVVL